MRIIQIFVIVASIALTGCTPWPSQGTGGYAARQNPVFLEKKHHKNVPSRLIVSLELAQTQWNVLYKKGARTCFPALMNSTQLTIKTIKQELAAHLIRSAANRLTVLKQQLNWLDQNVSFVSNRTQCRTLNKTYFQLGIMK